jgi:hypothetical protein
MAFLAQPGKTVSFATEIYFSMCCGMSASSWGSRKNLRGSPVAAVRGGQFGAKAQLQTFVWG